MNLEDRIRDGLRDQAERSDVSLPPAQDIFDRAQRRGASFALGMSAVVLILLIGVVIVVPVHPSTVQFFTNPSVRANGISSWPDGTLLDYQGETPIPYDEIVGRMTPAVVSGSGLRIFVIARDDDMQAFVASAQHLNGEGLWWCPDEGFFVSPFHGELFDGLGRLLIGSARSDLDRINVEGLDGGLLKADLATITPGQRRDGVGIRDIDSAVFERYLRWAEDGEAGPRPAFCVDHEPPLDRPSQHLHDR